jgi:single-stranded-DNA-specific exonuclease
METARLSLDLLNATDPRQALELAQKLDQMNQARRAEQDRIFKAALQQAEERADDPVLIVSDPSWSHGIIGIVAAKLLERYYKPTFVLQELEDGTAKGSARSYGDFSAVDGINATREHLIKGGGHKLAAGVTLKTENIDTWRRAMNDFYKSLKLTNQPETLLVSADVEFSEFSNVDETAVTSLATLEPHGKGNESPVVVFDSVVVSQRRTMGAENQHIKYTLIDKKGVTRNLVAFNAADKYDAVEGDRVRVWCQPSINEWRGSRTVEGFLVRMELLQ